MEQLTCRSCGAVLGPDETMCPGCKNVIKSADDTLVVTWDPAALPAQRPCPVCGHDLVQNHCAWCVQSFDLPEPAPPAALMTTLEPVRRAVWLLFEQGKVQVPPGQEVLLGRAPAAAHAGLFENLDNVSREHATVGVTATGQAWIRDEASTNGTFLGPERLPAREQQPLQDGDEIRLASNVVARVRFGDEGPMSADGST